MEKEKKLYIDNNELEEELKKYQTSGNMSSRLVELVQQLLQHMQNMANFRRYSKEMKEDMRSFAWVKLMRALQLFDFSKGYKAYSYLTRTIYNAYITSIAKEYKQRNIQNKLKLDLVQQMKDTYPQLAKTAEKYIDTEYIGED